MTLYLEDLSFLHGSPKAGSSGAAGVQQDRSSSDSFSASVGELLKMVGRISFACRRLGEESQQRGLVEEAQANIQLAVKHLTRVEEYVAPLSLSQKGARLTSTD